MADPKSDDTEPDASGAGPEFECDLLYALRAYSNYATQGLARKLAPKDVTVAEWTMLESLRAGPYAPADLANVMGVTRGAVSKLADRLVKKSLVTRRTKRKDGYVQILALTSKGAALVPELVKLNEEAISEVFKWLRKGDRAHLERILKDLVVRYREEHGID